MAQAGETLRGRWELVEPLGEGSFGKTWIVRDGRSGERAVAKLLDLGRAADWKAVELFEREAQALRNLSHDAIPTYLDAFEDRGQHVLVQRLAEGRSLEAWVRDGWRASDEELYEIADGLLDVLGYLQRLNPPLVHRDIKPANVIWDREQGRISLVDFGAVKAARERGAGGSTVVGTFGYMAPEQFRGRAEPATDLYGLGATLLFLLTHEDPAELPMRGLGIDVGAALGGGRGALVSWLERMVAPDVADRFQSAQHAREQLGRVKRAVPEYLEEPSAPEEEPAEAPVDVGGASGETPAWRALLSRPLLGPAELDRLMRLRSPGAFFWQAVFWAGGVALAVYAPGSWWMASLGVSFAGFAPLFMVSGNDDGAAKPPQAHLWERRLGLIVGALWYLCASFLLGWLWFDNIGLAASLQAISALFGLILFYVGGGEWLHMRNHVELERSMGVELPLAKDALMLINVERFEAGERLSVRAREQFGANAIWSLGLASSALVAGYQLRSGSPDWGALMWPLGATLLGIVYGVWLPRVRLEARRGLVVAGALCFPVGDASQVSARLKRTGSEAGAEEGTPTFEVQALVRGEVVWRVAESHEVVGEALARWLDGALKGACGGEVAWGEVSGAREVQEEAEEAFWKAERGW